MKRSVLLVLLLCCVLPAAAARHPAKRRAPAKPDLSKALVIRDVSVVDVVTGTLDPHRNVAIQGERILAIGPAAKVAGSRVIPGEGKFLIPGLWDMHVHLWQKQHQFPLFLAHGVTGIRDMGGDFARTKQWRAAVQKGTLLGPRIFTSGPPVQGVDEPADPRMAQTIVRSPEEARRAFDQLDDMQVDFIEVLPGLRWDAYFALTEFTRHWGHRLAGDVPDSVTAQQAIDARQGSIEHMNGIMLACSKDEKDLRRQRLAAIEKNDIEALNRITTAMFDSYSPRRAALLFEQAKLYDVMITPTLVAYHRNAAALEPDDPAYARVDPAIRKTWSARQAPRAVASMEFTQLSTVVREMQRAGTEILAGTDTGEPYTVPGAELHAELALLVKAGLTPAQALRTATLHPAKILRQETNLGSVQPGRYADLVLLEADPLKEITNTRKIAGVVVNGRYLSKAELKN